MAQGSIAETTPLTLAEHAAGWLERACILIPALDAEATLGAVVHGLRAAIPERGDAIFVVDDGSRDGTARVAGELGCIVLSSSASTNARRRIDPSLRGPKHSERSKNLGKGTALRAGLEAAAARGMTVALTVDADGQHPPEEARRVLLGSADERALVLGVRDLVRAGAPRANRFSNGISNHFLSSFAGRPLRDTQCGLRRYPIGQTLALDPRGRGYDFEAEVLLRAVWAGVEVVEEPVTVLYPEDRRTHFRVARDPWRILGTVLATVGAHWLSSEKVVESA
jgi:glycosyltransferase involved in cell wall biosynthesis